MKNYFSIILLFTCSLSFACDCSPSKPILEFYNAVYVFEGDIVSKVYAEDAQTYTVRFVITKHYKDGEKPEELSFVLKSEAFYTGESNSCDWSANKDEKWLVYAHLGNDDTLSFDGMCSNSKRINYSKINDDEQKVLDNGNDFILGNYMYYKEVGFNYTMPITDIDSILKKNKTKYNKSYFIVIGIFIDKAGNLQAVFGEKQYMLKYNQLFGLITGFFDVQYTAVNSFEKEALEIAKKIKKWEVKYHLKTKTPVAQVRDIIFQYDTKTNTWSYEL